MVGFALANGAALQALLVAISAGGRKGVGEWPGPHSGNDASNGLVGRVGLESTTKGL